VTDPVAEAQELARSSFSAVETLTATVVIDELDGSESTRWITYRRPGRWRIEDDLGLRVLHTSHQHVVRGVDGKLCSFPKEKDWQPEDQIGFLAWGDPLVLVGAEPVDPEPAVDAPLLTEVAGRAVRREIFILSRKRCTVFIDTASGLVLAQSTRLARGSTTNVYAATVTRLRIDEPVGDNVFAPVPEHEITRINRSAPTQTEIRHGGPDEPDRPADPDAFLGRSTSLEVEQQAVDLE
jgi:hypothetical protein